jgi:hypothetical protein
MRQMVLQFARRIKSSYPGTCPVSHSRQIIGAKCGEKGHPLRHSINQKPGGAQGIPVLSGVANPAGISAAMMPFINTAQSK